MEEMVSQPQPDPPALPGRTAIEISINTRKLQVLAVIEAIRTMGPTEPRVVQAKLQVGPPYLREDQAKTMIENLLVAGVIVMSEGGLLCLSGK